MSVLVVLFVCVVGFNLDIVVCQSCNDCVPATECAAARPLVLRNQRQDQEVLRTAFCGFQNKVPKICCSQIPSSEVENHPNVGLLPQSCGYIDGDRIIGGNETGLYEFPWMTLISHSTRDGLKFQCGGTVINNRYILTAAHCIKGLTVAGVRIGEHDLRTPEDCQGKPPKKVICEKRIQDIRVEDTIIHPQYHGKPGVRNDIGLLRLKKPINFVENAQPVCLPVSSQLRNRDVRGANATIAGWGFTETRESSQVLLSAYIPVHSAENCRSMYNRGASPTNEDATLNKLCAGENGKDSCNGDSGGPLMVPGIQQNKQRYIQYGIVSYGPRQCGSDFPGVYTDVSKYMTWILDNIKP